MCSLYRHTENKNHLFAATEYFRQYEIYCLFKPGPKIIITLTKHEGFVSHSPISLKLPIRLRTQFCTDVGGRLMSVSAVCRCLILKVQFADEIKTLNYMKGRSVILGWQQGQTWFPFERSSYFVRPTTMSHWREYYFI